MLQSISFPKTVSRLRPATEVHGYPMEDGIFGVNMEITRRGFFGGLSAQMLNNRKLFMGVDGVDGWACEGFERVTDRPEESLCHSHFVVLKDGTMSQTSADIALREGHTYEAAIWVKAYTDTATVTFGVAGKEQTFTVTATAADLRTALKEAYRLVEGVSFPGACYRKDIGKKALSVLED